MFLRSSFCSISQMASTLPLLAPNWNAKQTRAKESDLRKLTETLRCQNSDTGLQRNWETSTALGSCDIETIFPLHWRQTAFLSVSSQIDLKPTHKNVKQVSCVDRLSSVDQGPLVFRILSNSSKSVSLSSSSSHITAHYSSLYCARLFHFQISHFVDQDNKTSTEPQRDSQQKLGMRKQLGRNFKPLPRKL